MTKAGKEAEKSKWSLRHLQDPIKQASRHTNGVPAEGREEAKRTNRDITNDLSKLDERYEHTYPGNSTNSVGGRHEALHPWQRS